MAKKKQDAINKTINLYKKNGWKSVFTRLRFWYAPFNEVEMLLPQEGKIIDIGCAEGLLANFIGLASAKRDVLGIERDTKRLSLANKNIENVQFQKGDATKMNIPQCDAIVFVHVLHHLDSFAAQEEIIKKCYNSLKKNGKLIIVEINMQPTIKYFLTWFTDHFLVAWVFEKRIYTPIHFRKLSAWKNILEKTGFTTTSYDVSKGRPFANIILECKKK